MDHHRGQGDPGLLACALAAAGSGVPVFPCLPGGKAPLTPNGFHDATTNSDVIHGWWQRHPHANIATPTGVLTFDVLDVDVRTDGNGWRAYWAVHDAGLLDGWLRAIRTPSGGLHLHYPGTIQRNRSLRGLHVDFRGTGGYVLLPPSLCQTKEYSRRYELLEERPGPGRPLDWAAVSSLLVPPTSAPSTDRPNVDRSADPTPWLAAHVAKQTEGNRDNALFWAACRAVEAGAPDLNPLIAAAISTGLTERQAARTVRSAQATITGSGQRRPASLSAPKVTRQPTEASLAR